VAASPDRVRSKAAAGILERLPILQLRTSVCSKTHFRTPAAVFAYAIRGLFKCFRLVANGSRLSLTVSPIGNYVGQLMFGFRPIPRLMRRSLTNSLVNPRPSLGRRQPMGGAGSDRFCRSPRPFRLGAVTSRRSDTARSSLKGDHTKTHTRRCKARTTSYDAAILRCHALRNVTCFSYQPLRATGQAAGQALWEKSPRKGVASLHNLAPVTV
jgi:hypothetical protein